jgi:hypothetical protein
MYVRLAKAEEREAMHDFGDEYRQDAAATPPFIRHLSSAARPELTPHS